MASLPGPPTSEARNSLGVMSAVLGVVSIVSWLALIGPLFGVAAVWTGLVALRRVRQGAAGKRGLAIVGVVLGLLSILAGVGFLFLAAEQRRTGCWPFPEHTGCY